MRIIAVLMMVVLVTSCAPGAHTYNRVHHDTGRHQAALHSNEDDSLVMQRARTQQAKYADIPVPLYAVPLSSFYQEDSPESIEFAYASSQEPEALASWYGVQMESNGWQFVSQSIGVRTVLLYQKPMRWCVISMHATLPHTTETFITVLPA